MVFESGVPISFFYVARPRVATDAQHLVVVHLLGLLEGDLGLLLVLARPVVIRNLPRARGGPPRGFVVLGADLGLGSLYQRVDVLIVLGQDGVAVALLLKNSPS